MTDSLLARTGRALYGEQWQSPLARDLGVSDRTIRRWVSGEFQPSAGVYDDLLRLVSARRASLDSLEASLRQAGSRLSMAS